MALNPAGALACSHLSSPSLNPAAVVGGRRTLQNIDTCASASASARPAAPASDDDGSSSSPRPRPKLFLDSGASIHTVGDPRLLSNLRDAPKGMSIVVANGDTLPVTKIGEIQMRDLGFTIPGVYLAPGLEADLISVRVLTRSRICTWFDGDRAMLYAGPDLVGLAVAPPQRNGLYVLESLSVPETAAASSGKLLPVWYASTASRGSGFARSVSIGENSLGSMSSICRNSFGSVLCWLKALPNASPLFGAVPEAKRMPEPRVTNEQGRKRRTEGEGDSRCRIRID